MRKGNPNENFTREVMELFTVGGNYTEKRCKRKRLQRLFTGWGFNKEGTLYLERCTIIGEKSCYRADR
jgi:uncharacterized protein (DUF1800 family)